MRLVYHGCGHPIMLDERRSGHWQRTYFDAGEATYGTVVHACPHCGDNLCGEELRDRPPTPASELRAWCTVWPELLRQLINQLVARARSDATFSLAETMATAEHFTADLAAIECLARDVVNAPAPRELVNATH